MRMIMILLAGLFVLSTRANGDIIIFKNGSAKVGVIVEEEKPTQVTFREKEKVITVVRTNIERIEYSTPEENEKLRLKWKEEKQRLEEQRKKKREAEEKFEAAQKAKGFVQVNGEWISPGEAEARRQQEIRRQVENQKTEAGTEQQPEASEEIELPEILDEIDPDQKELFIENLKRQQKVQVSGVQVVALGSSEAAVKGTVVNGSELTAGNIQVEVECFDENGDSLGIESARVSLLRPGESGSFSTPFGVPLESIKETKAQVTSVRWQ